MSAGDWQTISGTSSVIAQYSRTNHGAFNGPFGGQVGYTATVTQSSRIRMIILRYFYGATLTLRQDYSLMSFSPLFNILVVS